MYLYQTLRIGVDSKETQQTDGTHPRRGLHVNEADLDDHREERMRVQHPMCCQMHRGLHPIHIYLSNDHLPIDTLQSTLSAVLRRSR